MVDLAQLKQEAAERRTRRGDTNDRDDTTLAGLDSSPLALLGGLSAAAEQAVTAAWTNSSGRDLSHWNSVWNYDLARAATDWVQIKITESTRYADPMAAQHHRGFGGVPRGPYHFARPVSIPDQIGWFLRRKREIGQWERLDMLDCEFEGVDGAFINSLVAEYRRQSGIRRVLVYAGLYDLTHACNPALWWDPDTPIWAARYRKIGPPADPDAWARHLGWDHPGLVIYQHDNATPLDGDGNTDINAQRMVLGEGDDDMPTAKEIADEVFGRILPFHANPTNPGGPAWMHLSGANWAAQEAEKILREQRAVLAAILAGEQDDVTEVDVLTRLEQAMSVEVDRLRAELAAAREADRVAVVEAVRDTVPAQLADQVVTRISERLAPVTPVPGGGA